MSLSNSPTADKVDNENIDANDKKARPKFAPDKKACTIGEAALGGKLVVTKSLVDRRDGLLYKDELEGRGNQKGYESNNDFDEAKSRKELEKELDEKLKGLNRKEQRKLLKEEIKKIDKGIKRGEEEM